MEETFSSLVHPLPPPISIPSPPPRPRSLAPPTGSPKPRQRRAVRRARRSVSPAVGARGSKHLSASGPVRAERRG